MNAHLVKFQKLILKDISLCSCSKLFVFLKELIFNIICNIGINTVKYAFHVFKISKSEVISTFCRSLSLLWKSGN